MDHHVRMAVRRLPELVWLRRSGTGELPAGNALSNTPAAGTPLFLLPSHTPVAVLQTVPYLHQNSVTQVYDRTQLASSQNLCFPMLLAQHMAQGQWIRGAYTSWQASTRMTFPRI